MLDRLAPPAEETARETTEAWIEAFVRHWRTPQPRLWFTGGAFSQSGIYSRCIALQIVAIAQGRLAKCI